MNLFKSHPSYLGVDIGSKSIKVVELRNEGGRPRLLTYGFVEESIDIARDAAEKTQSKIASLLTKVCQQSRITTKKTIAALPSFSVFSSIISLPVMNKKDLAKAIYWQAKKFVPMDLEEMTLDWKLLESEVKVVDLKGKSKILHSADKLDKSNSKDSHKPANSSPSDVNDKLEKNQPADAQKDKLTHEPDILSKRESKDIKVLIAAAPKKLVVRYVNIFRQADLELLTLETENFALERSLVGGEQALVMIVDIGDMTSDIIVIENNIPVLSRSVNVGGQTITQAIMSSMRVDEKRAEQFKRDITYLSQQGNLPQVIESKIAPIINEIKYCFDLYASQQSQQRIEKIILTGGSAFLPQLDEYLAKLLNIKVLIGDPWAQVVYPIELKPVLQELAPRFSVAVGLAMREIV